MTLPVLVSCDIVLLNFTLSYKRARVVGSLHNLAFRPPPGPTALALTLADTEYSHPDQTGFFLVSKRRSVNQLCLMPISIMHGILSTRSINASMVWCSLLLPACFL
jgi:hypothetical protein